MGFVSLPEELRIDIVETAVLSISNFTGSRDQLLMLSHVSREWRAMTLGAPKLWSDIRVMITGYSKDLVQLFL